MDFPFLLQSRACLGTLVSGIGGSVHNKERYPPEETNGKGERTSRETEFTTKEGCYMRGQDPLPSRKDIACLMVRYQRAGRAGLGVTGIQGRL
jgi:hypothetical protein